MMPRPDVVLFDVDMTLVDTGGAGRRAIGRAAGKLLGRPELFDALRFDGATDRGICRTALAQLGSPVKEPDIDRLLAGYLRELSEEVRASEGYRVLPGVEDLVGLLADCRALLGLGTGNIEAGARVKLDRAGLNHAFGFGGFGDDHEDRAEILRAGLARAERRLGRKARSCWVVGDTPLDMAAARAIGASVVLVATGHYPVAELAALNPELAVESLEDPRLQAWAMGVSA